MTDSVLFDNSFSRVTGEDYNELQPRLLPRTTSYVLGNNRKFDQDYKEEMNEQRKWESGDNLDKKVDVMLLIMVVVIMSFLILSLFSFKKFPGMNEDEKARYASILSKESIYVYGGIILTGIVALVMYTSNVYPEMNTFLEVYVYIVGVITVGYWVDFWLLFSGIAST